MKTLKHRSGSSANTGFIKAIIIIAVLILIAVGINRIIEKHEIGTANTVYDGMDASRDPIQTQNSIGNFTKKYGNNEFQFEIKADYKIAAKVQSIHHITGGDWSAKVGPYDFALAWGKIADSQMDKYIKYRQTGREYAADYSADCPVSVSYIVEHSANTHIIPSNDNIMRGVKAVKKGDIVYIGGHLVNVYGNINGQKSIWETSLNRTDSGCEVVYVTKLVIDEAVYE